MSKQHFNEIFNNQNWDFENLTTGHEKRFLKKLKQKKATKQHFWKPLAIACSITLVIGLIYFTTNAIQNYNADQVVFSKEVQQTNDYFASIIKSELVNLKQNETPKSKQVVTDALKEMELLEQDYNKLKLEIKKNGENKQIIYALITNMQIRITFLKNVLDQVETLNNTNYENII